MISSDPRLPVRQTYSPAPSAGWPVAEAPRSNELAEEGFPWQRSLAALLRFKWLIAGITIVGAALGVAGSRFIKPVYEAHATLWISSGGNQLNNRTGPIRAEELLTARSWPQLLRSFAILENVARSQLLYLHPAIPADSQAFAGFEIGEAVRADAYKLQLTPAGQFVLASVTRGVIDSGAVGDSIGRREGFRWAPPSSRLGAPRIIEFTVSTPRRAAMELSDQLDSSLPENSNLFQVSLRGTEPTKTSATLNALITTFVAQAAELKTRSLGEIARALSEQLEYAYGELRTAEIALMNFKANTITLPSEGNAVAGGAGGLEITRDPVFAAFFQRRLDLEDTRRDREELERTLAGVASGTASLNWFAANPAVQTYGQDLRLALARYTQSEADVRALEAKYKGAWPELVTARASLENLRTQVIPPLVMALITQMRERERDLDIRVASASRELREIPTRTVEDLRLRRNVAVRDNLYTMLKNRYEEARLAESSSLPDVTVLDHAAPPQQPSSNSAPQVILLGLAGGLGAAILLALLLDRLDRRFRYPEQVTNDLGLSILGAVPALKRLTVTPDDIEHAAQAVEAFRSLRLALTHAAGAGDRLQLTITSPGVGDGKSLVSANLALSFADAGYRTVLIDGDIRRGGLHNMFGVSRRPGLVDLLATPIPLEETLRPTSHAKLTLMPCGTRSSHGPELVASAALPALLAALRDQFEVILIDTPPLGAGTDPFAFGAATSNMVVVLRSGETDRKMAEAKLQVLDRLPVRILGAVLNDINARGAYRYYNYIYGYTASEELPGHNATERGRGLVQPV